VCLDVTPGPLKDAPNVSTKIGRLTDCLACLLPVGAVNRQRAATVALGIADLFEAMVNESTDRALAEAIKRVADASAALHAARAATPQPATEGRTLP
jgi:hypothetical protein